MFERRGRRAAVIGAGRMGRRHLQILVGAGLDVVGVADRRAEALELVAQEDGVPESALFTDAEKLLTDRHPDLVVVATTAPTHATFAILAARSRATHVLLEKPMATSLAECDAITKACTRAGAALAVNHQMRFMDQYRLPKEMLASDRFGGLQSMTVVAGNIGISMNGSHYVEAFRFVSDEPSASASAWFDPDRLPNPRGPEFEDRSGQILLRTASGRRFYLDAGGIQGHGVTAVYGAHLGQITVDELGGQLSWSARRAADRDSPTTRYGMPSESGHAAMEPADTYGPTRRVLDALLTGDGFPSSEEGRHAVAALVAAYVSAESGGREIAINGALPLDRTFPWA